ncbi:MAG: mevalonate kinase [Desulfurococcales archaeon]|jgi:mevalonate kinase|nr:mevalonate kinase [Desulfurococcales archaeon]
MPIGIPIVERCAKVHVPLKVTITGEHAVVYGYPALVAAIDRRIDIRICRRGGGEILLTSKGASIWGDISLRCVGDRCVGEISQGHVERLFIYAKKAIEISSRIFGDIGGLDIEISSNIPPGAGLGTSAAISAGIVTGYAYLANRSPGALEIASIARSVEMEVQGAASPMDTGAVSLGGVLLVRPRDNPPFKRINPRSRLEILIAITPKKKSTKETVSMVRDLYSKRKNVIDHLMRAIGEISEEASKAIEEGDLAALCELMNINHNILRAMGVVDRESEGIADIMRASGLEGVKISGGGWGGAVIGISRDGAKLEQALNSLSRAGYTVFISSIASNGIRYEEIIPTQTNQ